MDDVAVANVDSLDESTAPNLDDTRNPESIDRIQHLRQSGLGQISTVFELGSHVRLNVAAGLVGQ